MKRLIKSLAALALVVSMVGCSNESSEGQLESSTNVELKLKGNIASLKPSTRVNADGFEANDKVGVYVSMNNTLAQQGNTLDNVAFTYNNGAIVAPEGKEVYWGSKDVRISVWAYYPYDADISDNSACDFAVAVDQSEAAGFYGSDFVLASAKNLPSQETPVGLTFNHALSKVVFEFKEDGNTTAEHLKKSIAEVMINGLCVDGSIDLADGSVDLGSTTATITPNKVSDLNYAAIVYPQEGTLSLRVQFGDDIYLYSADVDYEPGYQYKYTLKVDLYKPELTLNAVKISEWGDGENTDGVMFDIISFTDAKFKEYLLRETLWVREGNTYVASGKIDANNDGEISIAEAEKVEKIDVDRVRCGFEITNFNELCYFVNLKDFNCTCQNLDKIDLSNNPKLVILDCGDNKIEKLDVSMLSDLELLRCGYNRLTELNVSANNKLHTLECNNNLLTVLDLSNNLQLTYVLCWQVTGGEDILETIYLAKGQEITSILKSESTQIVEKE